MMAPRRRPRRLGFPAPAREEVDFDLRRGPRSPRSRCAGVSSRTGWGRDRCVPAAPRNLVSPESLI